MDTIKLNNGVEMPQLVYGVFQVVPDEAERCVADALPAAARRDRHSQVGAQGTHGVEPATVRLHAHRCRDGRDTKARHHTARHHAEPPRPGNHQMVHELRATRIKYIEYENKSNHNIGFSSDDNNKHGSADLRRRRSYAHAQRAGHLPKKLAHGHEGMGCHRPC